MTTAVEVRDRRQQATGKEIVARRHVSWLENQVRWRWLLDSYEGGQRYRDATYGPDRRGLPTRNLQRHKREYPDPQMTQAAYQGYVGFLGSVNAVTADVGYGPYPGMLGADPNATSGDDDFELRRARTPVPEFLSEAVEAHLSKIFDQPASRQGPDDLTVWWADVNGKGNPIEDWMSDTIAPLLLTLGQIDVLFDRPPAPFGAVVETEADVARFGLDHCVATYILPENLVWWRLDPSGSFYVEVLVREYVDPAEWEFQPGQSDPKNPYKPPSVNGNGRTFRGSWQIAAMAAHGETASAEDSRAGAVARAHELGAEQAHNATMWAMRYVRFRHWLSTHSQLYDYSGIPLGDAIPHPYGRVPIVRVFDVRKHRNPHVGKSRYEGVAEYQREFYNRDSELILNDVLQGHPLLSGPEDFCQADNTISVGPQYLLPKKKSPDADNYEGWEYVSPPKDPADSIRQNKLDILDLKDRAACMTKPAGVSGTSGGTVAQSGISKQLDATAGNKLLTRLAKTLAKAERAFAEYAMLVLRAGNVSDADKEAIKVSYPSRFELFSLEELVAGIVDLQSIVANAGQFPAAEKPLLRQLVRQLLLGLDDEEYRVIDEEGDLIIDTKAATAVAQGESMAVEGASSRADALAEGGTAESGSESDPTGRTAGTMVSNLTPNVI